MTATEQPGARRAEPGSSSRWPGTRSPASSATSASTRRSTSRTGEVAECHSTSSLFRGYSRLHEGQGPARRRLHHQPDLRHLRRQPHHLLGLRAEHGLRHQDARRWPSGSSTSARRPSTCSTTPSSRTTWSSSTSARRWSRRPTRACWPGPRTPRRRTRDIHGYRTIADIMRAFNPFEGEVYKEALKVSRVTREMFCLMEGRHVHPSTLYPGRRRARCRRPPLFTDYLSPADPVLDFVKKAVAMNDDVFDFFYEALPGLRGGRPPPRSCSAAGAPSRTRTSSTTATRR